jgi:hypothetical protein
VGDTNMRQRKSEKYKIKIGRKERGREMREREDTYKEMVKGINNFSRK